MTFRTFLFWLHLVAGLISGLSIGIMCFTGTVLAFEKELIAWSERDARQIEPPPAGTPRLPLEQLQAKLRAAHPDVRPSGLVFQNDPRAAVTFTVGRSGGYYVNPYTGEVRQPTSTAMSGFMHTMTDLHRTLGFHAENTRPVGKLINGICNLAFCVLAITGLYLWMPRQWSWRALRPIVWFRQNGTARARDFNWHNAIGFWTAPVLIILTLTAVPISFRWGATVINTLTRTPAPASGGPGPGGAAAAPAFDVPAPAPGTSPLSQDALLAAAQQAVPDWNTLTLRTGAPGGRGRSGGPADRGGAETGRGGRGGRGSEVRGGAEGRGARSEGSGGPGTEARKSSDESRPATAAASPNPQSEIRNPQSVAPAFTVAIRQQASWPRTATTTLALNPYTGEVLRHTGYADQAAAQQVRSWTRFLHTGEALGWPGQFIAGLACLGGCFLVYTGFALSWRRFFSRATPRSDAASRPGTP